MDKVNVLVVSRRLHAGYLDEIAAVDPRISIKDGVEQFLAELHKKGVTGLAVRRLKDESSIGYEPQASEPQEDLDTLLAEAEVIFGAVLFPENLQQRAPRLKWLHLGGVGLDAYMPTGMFDSNIIVTNSRGAIATPIAEHVLMFMLMLAKNAPRMLENKRNVKWERFINMELGRKTVGIIGLGAIGGEVARLAKGIGMKVLATKRSAVRRESNVYGVDELYPPSDLLKMLAASDFVVIAAPLTGETKGMVGERELRAMKPTAFIINIARGAIVNQSAMTRALREGRIAGAGLDAFEPEPLPPDNELWKLPNVIMSSHMAGSTDTRSHRVSELFCENLRRYLAGKPLMNVIDRQKGY